MLSTMTTKLSAVGGWLNYRPRSLSFVTLKDAIRADELPPEIGLFYLNPKYRPRGKVNRHTSEMALVCVRRPKMRPTELKHILASLDNMIRKGGPVKLDTEMSEKLVAKLLDFYGEAL